MSFKIVKKTAISEVVKLYRPVLISTWNKPDFQTHFKFIPDVLSDWFDCEHVKLKKFFDVTFRQKLV